MQTRREMRNAENEYRNTRRNPKLEAYRAARAHKLATRTPIRLGACVRIALVCMPFVTVIAHAFGH